MLVMTAKVNKKKIAIVLAGIVVLVIGLIALFGGNDAQPTAATTAVSVAGNDDRVHFLNGFGWDVTSSPIETGQVLIPEKASEVFDRYNALQKSQGYDLGAYAGQKVMRYVYQVNNYPGATEPVYATVLISKNQVIGGDVTNTAPKGVMQGFRMPKGLPETTQPGNTAETPTEAPTQAPTEAATTKSQR